MPYRIVVQATVCENSLIVYNDTVQTMEGMDIKHDGMQYEGSYGIVTLHVGWE